MAKDKTYIPNGFEGFNPGNGRVAIFFPLKEKSKEGNRKSDIILDDETIKQVQKEKAEQANKKELRVFAIGEGCTIPVGARVVLEPRVFQRQENFIVAPTANEETETPSAAIVIYQNDIIGWFNN